MVVAQTTLCNKNATILFMEIKELLDKYDIHPDIRKGQYFIRKKFIARRIVDLADIKKDDTVLEIGAGTGNITYYLAKKANRVIALEVDKQFKPLLIKLSRNVEIVYEDALSYLQKRSTKFDILIGNIPFHLLEPLMQYLLNNPIKKAILVVPLKFIKTLQQHPTFGKIYKLELAFELSKKMFYPQPNSNTGVVIIERASSLKNLKNGKV